MDAWSTLPLSRSVTGRAAWTGQIDTVRHGTQAPKSCPPFLEAAAWRLLLKPLSKRIAVLGPYVLCVHRRCTITPPSRGSHLLGLDACVPPRRLDHGLLRRRPATTTASAPRCWSQARVVRPWSRYTTPTSDGSRHHSCLPDWPRQAAPGGRQVLLVSVLVDGRPVDHRVHPIAVRLGPGHHPPMRSHATIVKVTHTVIIGSVDHLRGGVRRSDYKRPWQLADSAAVGLKRRRCQSCGCPTWRPA